MRREPSGSYDVPQKLFWDFFHSVGGSPHRCVKLCHLGVACTPIVTSQLGICQLKRIYKQKPQGKTVNPRCETGPFSCLPVGPHTENLFESPAFRGLHAVLDVIILSVYSLSLHLCFTCRCPSQSSSRAVVEVSPHV